MTTIAYKDGVMACDSAWSDDGTVITRQIKIRRTAAGGLLGSAGHADSRSIERLLDKVKTVAQVPLPDELIKHRYDFRGLLVLPPRRGAVTGRVWWIDIANSGETKEWHASAYEIVEGITAVGSGGLAAMVAMACGKSAVEAVRLAVRFDNNSCLPVHSIKLVP